MQNKFYPKIREILLHRVLQDYKINKTFRNTKNNYKNFVLLEKSIQKGGSKLSIKYENEVFIFDELDDPYSSVKSYVLQAKESDDDCIMITIDKATNISSIDNLTSNGIKCSDKLVSEVGKHLIKLTIKLLKENKEKFNIKKIMVSDHSFLYCKNIKLNISLADLYTLKHGITFYGSFGFTPVDRNLKNKFKRNYQIMQKLKVNDSKLLYYLEKYHKKYNNIDHLLKYINESKDELLMDSIKYISSKEKFDDNCKVLNYIIPKIFKSNNITSFHNIQFELDI